MSPSLHFSPLEINETRGPKKNHGPINFILIRSNKML